MTVIVANCAFDPNRIDQMTNVQCVTVEEWNRIRVQIEGSSINPETLDKIQQYCTDNPNVCEISALENTITVEFEV